MRNWFLNYLADSPLREAAYRHFYTGALGHAMAYAMMTTTAAWLMATLTPSAFMVAMVQTATTAPAMLVGLLAGALSDIFDRRRVMLLTECLLFGAALLAALAQFLGWLGPGLLLLVTLMIGVGVVFFMPAQWASVNDLVPREKMPAAVSLASVANNSARSIGPALAGVLTVWVGVGSAFLAAAVGFGWMVFVAWRMPPRPPSSKARETVFSGLMGGVRYFRHSEIMRALSVRTTAFVFCSASLWALLPVVARDLLHQGAVGYGSLLTGFGIGAVCCAVAVPSLFRRFSVDTIVVRSSVLWTAAMVLLVASDYLVLALIASAVAGMAWVSALSVLATATQSNAPDWVRARALSVNFLAVQASLALGSALWGAVASSFGVRVSLCASAVLMVLLILCTRRWKLTLANEADVRAGKPPSDLVYTVEPAADDGPVLVQVEYAVSPERRQEFLRALFALEAVRRRNGAGHWLVFHDLENVDLIVERYVVDSWAGYMRLRSRVTVADRDAVTRVEVLARADVPVRFSRLIGFSSDQPWAKTD